MSKGKKEWFSREINCNVEGIQIKSINISVTVITLDWVSPTIFHFDKKKKKCILVLFPQNTIIYFFIEYLKEL